MVVPRTIHPFPRCLKPARESRLSKLAYCCQCVFRRRRRTRTTKKTDCKCFNKVNSLYNSAHTACTRVNTIDWQTNIRGKTKKILSNIQPVEILKKNFYCSKWHTKYKTPATNGQTHICRHRRSEQSASSEQKTRKGDEQHQGFVLLNGDYSRQFNYSATSACLHKKNYFSTYNSLVI